MKYISINPFTEETLATFEVLSSDMLEQTLQQAHSTQQQWRSLPMAERVIPVLKLAALLKEHCNTLAGLATLEMGKTLEEAKLEVLKCARGCEYYAAHASRILTPVETTSETGKNVQLIFQPLGIVLGVFPWNFPFWQIIRSAVPTVLAGNAMLIKPAPNVPQCSLKLKELIQTAGFDKGIMEVIFVDELQVTQLLADGRVKAATLTGSERAGSTVASQAAKFIKKSVLELGGSDPFIVFPDADLERTLNQAITARFQNNGQSCIAAKRFILHQQIADSFLAGLKNKMSMLVCGNPMESTTQIGPLARLDLRDKLAKQVDDSVKEGAQLFYQHPNLPAKGYFYPPTILTQIPTDSVAFSEELFGPVVSVYTFNNDNEAIALANATEFGLGASIWSANVERAAELAHRIECGQVFINEMVKSQPDQPFGGVKKSGFGRELGEFGLKEFCNVKAIWK